MKEQGQELGSALKPEDPLDEMRFGGRFLGHRGLGSQNHTPRGKEELVVRLIPIMLAYCILRGWIKGAVPCCMSHKALFFVLRLWQLCYMNRAV